MEGKLVRLRAYEKSDLDSIMKWVNDEEVTDLLGGEMLVYPVSSIAEAKFIEAAAAPSDKQKTFVIETLTERKIHRFDFVQRDRLAESPRQHRHCDWRQVIVGQGIRHRRDADNDEARLRQDEPSSALAGRTRLQFARDRVVRKMRIQARSSAAPTPLQARQVSRHDRDGDSRERVSRPALARAVTGRFPKGSPFAGRSRCCC